VAATRCGAELPGAGLREALPVARQLLEPVQARRLHPERHRHGARQDARRGERELRRQATLSGITIIGDASKKISICDRYQGNNSGGEPTKLGTGADGTVCRYTPADVAYR